MRRSLVLITIDCVRADHVGFLGYGRPTTPFLDSLATQSLVFSNALAAGAPTYYSFPAILASRSPLALGRDVVGLAPGEATLAPALKAAGYRTAAFLAGNPYLSSRFGYEQGFDVFRDFLETKADSGPAAQPGTLRGRFNRKLARACASFEPARRVYDELYFQYCQRIATQAPGSLDELRRFPAADVMVDHALAWLRATAGAPFFLWLHLMDPHSPYYPKQEALEMMEDRVPSPSRARYIDACWNRGDLDEGRLAKYRNHVIRLYDAGIRWADAQIARLAAALESSHRWNDCALAVTADHGEEFLDHGGRYHSPSVHEELIRVPLLLRIPDVIRGKAVQAPFSLVHLAPTLLEAIQVPVPQSFQGSSYWPHLASGEEWDEPAVIECVPSCTNPFRQENRVGGRILAVREKRFKLAFNFATGREELFDLVADPAEQQPLSPGNQVEVRKRLLEYAHRHVAESHQLRHSSHRVSARLRDIRLELASSAQSIASA
jgi:arylsulfatase A-like enzyme